MSASRLTFFAVLASGLLGFTASLSGAADGGFVATLSTDQQTAAGLPSLSAAERAALDQLVATELALIRQGELRELNGTFASRRTEAERKSAGLDRLTPAELARLDELVAAALVARPKPKERPRIKDGDIFVAAPRAEIHGSVSLTYGRGGGGDFHSASLWLDYYDPATGLGLGFGLSNFTGPGFYGCYPDYNGNGSRYCSPFPVYYDAFHGAPRGDSSYGDGQSLRALSSRDSFGYGRRR